MIASFSKNIIFIKTRKTGGTSVEIVLSDWCSDGDICSTISGEDELIRYARGGKARAFINDPAALAAYDEAVKRGDLRAIKAFKKNNPPTFYSHMPATKVRGLLPDLWDRAYKFAVARHPYERAVSDAWWKSRKKWFPNIASFLDAIIETEAFPSAQLYTENDKVIVDEVIPYDSMWARVGEIGERVGAPPIVETPKAKANYRKDPRPAAEILSAAQKRRIYERCAFEFELMGFER